MSYTTVNVDFLKRAGNYNIGKQINDEEITLVRYFDTSTDNLASGSYYKIFSFEAGFLITEAYSACVTAETTSGTDTFDLTINDATTTTILSNADLSTTGDVTATNTRFYNAAAGFICIKPDAALATAKFYVVVKGLKLNTAM